MANISKPAGLSPVKYLNGSKYTGKGQIYSIAAADTNPFYIGDLVKLTGSGDVSGISEVTLGTAGATAVGVITGIGTNKYGAYANPNALQQNYRPTGAQTPVYYALVEDDPNVIFEIQEGSTATNLTAASIGLNANILYAAPAAGVYVSGTTLDNGGTTAPATTSTLNLKILRFAPRIDNQFFTTPSTGGAGQKWWVLINNHSFRTGITGV